MKKASSLKPDTQLSGWLYLTARNCALHMKRGASRRERYEREMIQMNPKSSDSAAWNEIRSELDSAMERLPAAQREAIVLRFFSGLSEADAAQQLGCADVTIRTRIARGVEKLREHFGRRGTIVTSMALAGLLANRSVEAVSGRLPAAIINVCSGKTAVSTKVAGTAKAVMSGHSWGVSLLVIGAIAALLAVSLNFHFSPQQSVPAAIASLSVPTYIVDANHAAADDTNPGTETRPFKTLVQAAKVARAGDRILIMPGAYGGAAQIMNSGTKEKPIVFEASKDGKVIVTDILKGVDWKEETGGDIKLT